jgi:KaiC/GvpD/RAD55 family RecA-like ATPase
MNENQTNTNANLEIFRASEITPKEVKWLWYPYIPFGKVTLLQGDPGDGKSKLMLSLAAFLSVGKKLPFTEDEEQHEPMTVIYQTTEDDADDTIVPRFNSSGGNGDNLIFIKEDVKTLTFGDERIREAIEKYNARLLILDPLSSYIGEECSMNNANETRAEFNHLIAVAKDTGCAIVIISHMNKAKDTSPLYRTNGSIDIAGAARSILAVTKTANKENPAERYLVQVKSNLAPMGSAIVFEVADKGVNFLDEVELSAEDAFAATALRMGRPNEREEAAKDFIRDILRNGRRLASGLHRFGESCVTAPPPLTLKLCERRKAWQKKANLT